MTVFTLALLPVLLSFGFWQLDREQQKIQLQAQYNQRASQTPVEARDVDWNSTDLGWIAVKATGRFNSAQQFLLDNRIHQSRVGYEVISPFVTDYGTILVNRGWVAQGPSRAELPDVEISEAEIGIVGHIYVPDGETMVLAADTPDAGNWPILIQRVDVTQMATLIGSDDTKPFVVRLTDESAAVLQTNWVAINMRPETHRGYAIQWFLMAAVLLILYVMFSFRKPEN